MDQSLFVIIIFRLLCFQLHKVYYNLSQNIFSSLFIQNSNFYNLQSEPDFIIAQVTTVFKGSNSIRCYGPKIYSLASEEVKYTDSSEKSEIKIEGGNLMIVYVPFVKITSPASDFWKCLIVSLMQNKFYCFTYF